MTLCQFSSLLLLSLVWSLHLCYGIPIYESLEEIPSSINSVPGFVIFIISAAVILLVSYLVIGCVCCPNKSIKALTYQNGFPVTRLNDNNPLQFENPSEFAIFPPHSAVIDLQPVGLPYPTFDDKVTFEPLPDILPRKLSGQSDACSSRPAHFRALLKTKVSLHDWFDDPTSNFPRDHLQYISELGNGWFGRIVEGEANHILNTEEKTAVIVKILREEASPSEHLHFLHEVRPYRDLSHPNVIRLLGRCLESDPFLLIMEHSISDLKTYLIQQENKDILLTKGIPLQMACNIASGLKCMHENGFIHMDFAAHNCFVCSDLTVKVGDYGTSFNRCREDYYCLGEIALPIRWCSPETLLCTEATIETKEITKEANIWAFGVVLWEIFEFGKLPYGELTNEEVLQKVLIERSVQLQPPCLDFPVKEEMSLIMKECWKPAKSRPPMDKVEKFLARLYNDRHNLKTLESSFEERWNALQHKVHEVKSISSDRVSLKFENDFSERSDSHNYSSDNERFSSFENSFDVFSKNINGQLSPSLRVLNGSIDELTENDILSSVSLGRERSASAMSDRTLSNLDDDGSQIGEVVVVGDQVSEQSSRLLLHKHQQNSFNNNVVAPGKENGPYNINLSSGASFPNDFPVLSSQKVAEASEVKTLDGNYNELPSVCESENGNVMQGHNSQNGSNRNVSREISKSPDFSNRNVSREISKSPNSNDFVTDSVESEIKTPENVSDKGAMKLERPCTLNSVPDIVVHESPSVFEGSHDENENLVPDYTDITPTNENQKAFRFVFKEESNSTDDSKNSPKEIISEDSPKTPDDGNTSSGRPPAIKGRSHPLTSTPMKNTHEINQSNDSPVSFTEHNDSGNVFYASSISDIGKSGDTTQPKPDSQLIDDTELQKHSDLVKPLDKDVPFRTTSNGTLFYEVPSSTSDFAKESVVSCDTENFVSAQSTFHVNNLDAISKTFQVDDSLSDSKDSPIKVLNNLVVKIPTVSVEREYDCALSSESLDKDYKCPSFKETKSDTTEDLRKQEELLSGEPVTPDVSFNVSSCSYENEGRTFSTSSPGISSENVKDSDETSGSRYKVVDRNQHYSGRNFVAAEANVNNLTLSEASSAEFLDSYSPNSDSFAHSEENRMESAGNLRGGIRGLNFPSTNHKTDLFYDEDDFSYDSDNAQKAKLRLNPYDEVIVEDLETGEQTIITDSYSNCDDYENSQESDDILKINTETDEAIIVDSSQALIGFVPSRSIEMLQDCEIISNMNPLFELDEEREESDSNQLDCPNSESSSPAGGRGEAFPLSPAHSPEAPYPLHPPYRNFSLQNEVIEEEITDEIVTPSSIRSTASFSSYGGDERMSSASDSLRGKHVERGELPTMEHYYGEESPISEARNGQMDDYSESDEDLSECSPIRRNINGRSNHARFSKDMENNHLTPETQDVMYSLHPTQTVRWHSDDTLDVVRGSPVVIEGREILAGGRLETRGMSVKDITTALHQLEADSLRLSPSPYSSLESSPCREAYTPDFEESSSSDSEDSEDPSSCSSTSGSFECVHNKFKDSEDISKAVEEGEEEEFRSEEVKGRGRSPLKVFSKTWDCHATPTKGVLVTPEKKFHSMRKSVSFHEDPKVVFEYPPCSDSEDGPVSEEINPWKVDYKNYADWELQMGDNEEIEEVLEIEELDSEPYVRRPTYGFGSSTGPMNRPMLYSLTSGFSDDDMDFSDPIPTESVAPSNSPEEGKQSSVSVDQIGNLIQSQLNNLAIEESRLKRVQNALDQQSLDFAFVEKLGKESPVQSDDPISEPDGNVEESLHDCNDMESLEWANMDSSSIPEDPDISDYWEDKFSKEKKFPLKNISEQLEETPHKDYSKLRLNTLVTLEESESLSLPVKKEPIEEQPSEEQGSLNTLVTLQESLNLPVKTEPIEEQGSLNALVTLQESLNLPVKTEPIEEQGSLNALVTLQESLNLPVKTEPIEENVSSVNIQPSEEEGSQNTLITLQESLNLSMAADPIKGPVNTENINENKDSESDVNREVNNKLQDINVCKELPEESIDNLNVMDPTQSLSLEYNSKDSVNSSGAFLLSSNASLGLDCLDMNGLAEMRYFDLNDSSIVHTESDYSGFMSSLEVMKESDKVVSQKSDSQVKEEIIPTLDFFNVDTIVAPSVVMSEKSGSENVVLPLALDSGNKRPHSMKFTTPFCDNVMNGKIDNVMERKTFDDSVSTEQTVKETCLIDNLILEKIPENNSSFQNTNMDLLTENKPIVDVLKENRFSDQKLDIKENINNEAEYLPSMQSNGTSEILNKDLESIVTEFSDSSTNMSTETVYNPTKNDSQIEYPIPSSNKSDILLDSHKSLPENRTEDCGTYNSDSKNNFVVESVNIKKDLSSEESEQISKEKSSLESNIIVEKNITSENIEDFIVVPLTEPMVDNKHKENMFSNSSIESNILNSSLSTVQSESDGNPIAEQSIIDFSINPEASTSKHDASSLQNTFNISEEETNVVNQTEADSIIKVKNDTSFTREFSVCPSSDTLKESALDLVGTENGAKAKVPKVSVPQIVVSPASESEVEDELEEYLRKTLKSVAEEDFSVTSQFTVRPFEDVFGSYVAPEESKNYAEACNFEFDSGDFFDDDFSSSKEIGRWDSSIDPVLRRDLSTAPPMVERGEKVESSPLCYVSKDATHL